MLKNVVQRSVVTLAMTVGVLAATAAGAQAAGTGSSTSPAARLSGTVRLDPGQNQLFSTWFWGSTTLCATNLGSVTGVLEVASSGGADPEYLYPPAFSTQCISRSWWGVPVWGTNVGTAPLDVIAS